MSPRQSYNQLNNSLTISRKRFINLSTDQDYQITTWRAKEYILHDMTKQGYNVHFLALLQIQDFKKQQAEYEDGPEDFTKKIRAICKISDPNIIMRVRCSKDEILFFLSASWVSPIDHLKTTLRVAGVSAITVHKKFSYGSIPDELRTLQSVAQARKEGYQL